MIPRRAFFYWDGEDIPLRRASILSFRKQNPEWEIMHLAYHGGIPPMHGREFRARVLRSDYARYEALHKVGGIYFDTDIIFTAPVPKEWNDADLVLPMTREGLMYGIHALGSARESAFFKEALRRADVRKQSPVKLGCQSLGIKLFEGENIYETLSRIGWDGDLKTIPIDAFLQVPWSDVEKLWSDLPYQKNGSLGLHWYGGDPMSREYESLPLADLPECMVKKALRESGVAF